MVLHLPFVYWISQLHVGGSILGALVVPLILCSGVLMACRVHVLGRNISCLATLVNILLLSSPAVPSSQAAAGHLSKMCDCGLAE